MIIYMPWHRLMMSAEENSGSNFLQTYSARFVNAHGPTPTSYYLTKNLNWLQMLSTLSGELHNHTQNYPHGWQIYRARLSRGS